ncbi:MAG: signal recognition particle, SRP19 subunit [Piptocephalis tieghemiana]|nr:MAG: signal recognition particle, SRP19 subunit [Piptocephalis tieghemiana]
MDDIDNMDFMPEDPGIPGGNTRYVEDPTPYKKWVCIYPVYLDSTKSYTQGRKVSKADAYPSPDPRAIAEAARRLALRALIEMDRMHPKSFGTLGRVRIQLRKEDGSLASMTIQNRRVLLRKIGSLLPDIQPSMPRSENDDLPPHIAAMLDSMPDDEEDEDEEEGGEKSKKALKGSSSGDAGPLPSSAGAIEASLSPSPSTTTPSGGGKKKRGKKRR